MERFPEIPWRERHQNMDMASEPEYMQQPETQEGQQSIDLYNDDDQHSRQIQMLYDRINRLDVFDKAIILLWLESMTYQDIASVVGISTAAVTTRLFRIKEQLKPMSNK